MAVYFRKAKIGKPNKMFSFGTIYTIDLGLFILSGHNNGIEWGFVSPSRTWYSIAIKYNRFKRANHG